MNDDTLTTALDRMATALEPPVAAHELIDARRSRLRRRRRVATGLTAASVFAVIAAGGIMANGLGNADPAPDGVPAASDGPASSVAVDDAPAPEVVENDEPWHCDAESLTSAEIDEFRKDVINEAQLSLDVVDEKIRAYLLLGHKSNVVYEIEARRAAGSEDVEILAVIRCGNGVPLDVVQRLGARDN
jgi:hypothetical protein